MRTKKIKGKHFIFDLYGCDPHEIDSAEHLEEVLLQAADAAKMEVLHTHFHKFSPHGITAVLLLSTSHISVHTWPEYGYAAFDVFSCSDEAQTKRAVNHIVKHIQHSRKRLRGVDRGYAKLQTIDIPIYKTGKKKAVKVERKLAEIKSPFQNIQVLDLDPFGKTLLIDGITQISESDAHLYDAAITRLVGPTTRNILVLGGGDGSVAARIIDKYPKAIVTIVELDPEVIYCAKTYFDKAHIFEHPRVNLVIGDAIQFLRTNTDTGLLFDGVIFDLTDNPVGSGKARAKLKTFYEKILTLSLPVLKKNGWIATQAGVKKAKRPLVTSYEVLRPLFINCLDEVSEKNVKIPSFLEDNVFLYGKKRKKA